MRQPPPYRGRHRARQAKASKQCCAGEVRDGIEREAPAEAEGHYQQPGGRGEDDLAEHGSRPNAAVGGDQVGLLDHRRNRRSSCWAEEDGSDRQAERHAEHDAEVLVREGEQGDEAGPSRPPSP